MKQNHLFNRLFSSYSDFKIDRVWLFLLLIYSVIFIWMPNKFSPTFEFVVNALLETCQFIIATVIIRLLKATSTVTVIENAIKGGSALFI